jgi:hypothetical protein
LEDKDTFVPSVVFAGINGVRRWRRLGESDAVSGGDLRFIDLCASSGINKRDGLGLSWTQVKGPTARKEREKWGTLLLPLPGSSTLSLEFLTSVVRGAGVRGLDSHLVHRHRRWNARRHHHPAVRRRPAVHHLRVVRRSRHGQFSGGLH